jgi:hypothetical protein
MNILPIISTLIASPILLSPLKNYLLIGTKKYCRKIPAVYYKNTD